MSLQDRSPEPEGGLSELDKILQNLGEYFKTLLAMILGS